MMNRQEDKYSVQLASGRQIPVKNIYCVGRNYRAHAKEMDSPEPEEPIFFQKALTALSTDPVIRLPQDRTVHYELEVVVLMGKNGEQIPMKRVMDHVSGLALGLDLTDRSLQSRFKSFGLPWFLSKSFKGSAVVAGDFTEPDNPAWSKPFWLDIDGQRRQEGRLEDMIFPIPNLVTYLSNRIPLLEGDLIYTGTPEGVGELTRGNRLVLGLVHEMKWALEVV